MSDLVLLVALVSLFVIGLILIPFGLPGLWVMVLALLGYSVLTGFARTGPLVLGLAFALAIAGEVLDYWLGFRFARRYGGSARAGWGAVMGGVFGAIVGTPVPLLGNVIGAFVGAFAGATFFEYTRGRLVGSSVRAGWGAVLGRAAAAASKIAFGLVIGIVGTYAALTGPPV